MKWRIFYFVDFDFNILFVDTPVKIVRGSSRFDLKNYAVPDVADDEILIEKTPDIVHGDINSITGKAINMKEIVPNVKLLVFICDPVKRLFSNIVHHSKEATKDFRAKWGNISTPEGN